MVTARASCSSTRRFSVDALARGGCADILAFFERFGADQMRLFEAVMEGNLPDWLKL